MSDELLDKLSDRVPHRQYDKFCNKLLSEGDTYNRAHNILASSGGDYMEATRKCLAMWKDRTGGHLRDLEKILLAAGLGGLRHLVTPR